MTARRGARSVGTVTEFRTVRVAAVQATPVILDAEATVAKAVGLLGEAAARGAELAVLPETFVPLYPSNRWAKGAAAFGGYDELWERLWANAVDVPARWWMSSSPPARATGCTARSASTSARPTAPARSTTRCCSSVPTGSCTSTASSCPRSTSGSSMGSGRATTCRSSPRRSGASAA